MSENRAPLPMPFPDASSELERLVAVTALLRAPGGCPWDAEQTHESLVRYLTEETHELIDAIEAGSRDELLEELGDVLYQVVFHADIAAHTPGEEFTIEDVAAHMTAKMVGRHPHVFGDLDLSTAGDVENAWDSFKAAEKPARTSVLDGVPLGMPALALADKLLGKARKLGVTAPEVPLAAPAADEDELGAQLLSVVGSARARGLDPERALRSALRTLRAEMSAAEVATSESTAAETPDAGADYVAEERKPGG
ncbi:MazG family protein [Herbiconiux sp. A18JL235]|uniref:MazG family protein n=1 Tax=Herbiconiux sp. A18JL235 TaxID=3152363 RepID=A0AB39BLD4_9MICO